MKIPGTRAALKRYDLMRDPETHLVDPTLPDNPGPVHCVEPDEGMNQYKDAFLSHQIPTTSEPLFLEVRPMHTVCGRRIRVLLPLDYNTKDPDACRQCTRWLELRESDPEQFHREYREWQRERMDREQEQHDTDEWNRRNGNIV